ncbi:uncharacterized protein EHS24_001428 [Apiotrichum porosum]|uniref:Uncharacterized protein n=1 Tax=Apiotrichum porosum TaxID=105984 RepID=A0A427XKU4_9TREE|nr:uncharacterized protein EHS24_001428 [Apiotrichum porosum]RSH79384.1 hypothetical protein EHS24_001428 [Apiotrichum porosum]
MQQNTRATQECNPGIWSPTFDWNTTRTPKVEGHVCDQCHRSMSNSGETSASGAGNSPMLDTSKLPGDVMRDNVMMVVDDKPGRGF